MIRALILIVTMFIATQAWATDKAPDYLLYAGKRFLLNSYPLELYFEEHCELRPATAIVSSDNYRGYTATYLIAENYLFIHDIVAIRQDSSAKIGYREHSVLQEVFPDSKQRKLSWFSGLLVVPDYGLTESIPTEATEPLNYLLFRIKHGMVRQNLPLSPEQFSVFKKIQFTRYRESEAYRRRVFELSKWLPTASDDELAELIFDEGNFLQTMEKDSTLPLNLFTKTTQLHRSETMLLQNL